MAETRQGLGILSTYWKPEVAAEPEMLSDCVRAPLSRSGETFPVSCPFKCPRMPQDARLFPGQLLAVLRNALRDNRFVLAAVRVS